MHFFVVVSLETNCCLPQFGKFNIWGRMLPQKLNVCILNIIMLYLQVGEVFTVVPTMYGAPVDLSFRNICKLTGG